MGKRCGLLAVFAFILAGVNVYADGLLMASLGKEVVVDTVLIRRAIVGDDWVFEKDSGVLYRRYIPSQKGFLFFRLYKGNKILLQKVGKITRYNEKIVVYGSYEKAVLSGLKFVVSEESKKFIPDPNKKVVFFKRWWRKRVMKTL